jgi:transketolase
LRLGFGIFPKWLNLPEFNHTRLLCRGNDITIIGMGPILLNLLGLMEKSKNSFSADVFAISEMPIPVLSEEINQSIKKTAHVLVIEEHVKRGGLGEHLASFILEKKLNCTFNQLYAKGYPNGRYGSQIYHQTLSGLDECNIAMTINQILHG